MAPRPQIARSPAMPEALDRPAKYETEPLEACATHAGTAARTSALN